MHEIADMEKGERAYVILGPDEDEYTSRGVALLPARNKTQALERFFKLGDGLGSGDKGFEAVRYSRANDQDIYDATEEEALCTEAGNCRECNAIIGACSVAFRDGLCIDCR